MPNFRLVPIRGQSKRITLGSDVVSIGRGPENTLPILDEKASRKHCVIEPDGRGGFTVRDLQSRNGTKLNEAKIEAPLKLKAGDVIRVGQHEFLVEGDSSMTIDEDDVDEVSVAKGLRDAPDFVTARNYQSKQVQWVFDIAGMIDNLPPKDAPLDTISLIDSAGKPSAVLAGNADGPSALRLLLLLASKARATDIHCEPKAETVHVRIRVDGDMVPIIDLPKRVGELVFGVVKAACAMQVAGRDAMQDGHFSIVFPDRRVEYRISFTPSIHGQKLVVRILDGRGSPKSLSDLGMLNYMEDRLRRAVAQDSGMVLCCGPTGSGKTTTLYNAIREIDRTTRNVITIEDPVEYQLDGTTQIPIDEQKGNTFNQLLRSVLRQDPDVILVGEIRDEETARTAMQASLTGHLVFSTVHAKETVASVFRLLDLKVEPYLVANSLDLIVAQRLVRVLWDSCKRPVMVTPGQSTRLGRFLNGKTEIYTATGCGRCLRTGYRGRRALFEMLDFNDELRDIVLKEPSIQAMKRIIEQGLFTTMQQFGWRMVSEGTTSLDEVDRVAGI